MNSRRAETFSSLLILILVVIMIIAIGRWYMITREIETIHAEDARRIIGTDKALSNAVNDLESTLIERVAYQFVIESDPLDLTKVVLSEEFIAKLGATKVDPDEAVMRLATTIVGADGIAAIVIRYLGSSHVLRVGDVLDGWKVVEIGVGEAVLTRWGERTVLEGRPARERLKSSGQMLSVDPRDIDAIANGNY
jgi:hypothetical protein